MAKKVLLCWSRQRSNGTAYITCKDKVAPSPGQTLSPSAKVMVPEAARKHCRQFVDLLAQRSCMKEQEKCNSLKDAGQRERCGKIFADREALRVAGEDWRLAVPPRFRKPVNLNEEQEPVIGWKQVNKNIERTLQEDSKLEWVKRVYPEREWDYKTKGDYAGSEGERAGNVNYGATCVAAGFEPETCLRAGGVVQGVTDLSSNREMYGESKGRPWDLGYGSCMGEPNDDCKNVSLGIRYGLDYLNSIGKDKK